MCKGDSAKVIVQFFGDLLWITTGRSAFLSSLMKNSMQSKFCLKKKIGNFFPSKNYSGRVKILASGPLIASIVNHNFSCQYGVEE